MVLSLSLFSVVPYTPDVTTYTVLPFVSSSGVLLSGLARRLGSFISFTDSFLGLPFRDYTVWGSSCGGV